MIDEQWSHWSPLEGLSGSVCIDSIIEKQATLEINLRVNDAYDGSVVPPRRRNMRIFFQSPIFFYKNVDEYCAIDDTLCLREKYGDNFVAESALFQLTHSFYLELLSVESPRDVKDLQLKHFVILESSSRIDIIALEEPLVEWI